MAPDQIEVGATYRNGAGRERKVISINGRYERDGAWREVEYEIVSRGGSKSGAKIGTKHKQGLWYFAEWARERVDIEAAK